MSQQQMIRPEQVASLPMLDVNQKQQYTAGLSGLWKQYESSPEGSQQKAEVKAKIVTASHRIMQQISARSKPAGAAQQRPTGQNMGDGNAQMTQQQNAQFNQQRPVQQPAQAQQNETEQQIKERVSAEINRIMLAPPENVNTREQFEQYKSSFKTQLGSFRYKAEMSKQTEMRMRMQMQQLQASGQQITDDMRTKLATTQQAVQDCQQKAAQLIASNERHTERIRQSARGDQAARLMAQGGTAAQQPTASPAQNQQPGQQPRPIQTPVQQPQRPAQPGPNFPQQYLSAPNSAVPQSANTAQRPHALSQQGAIAKAQEHNNQASVTNPHPAVQTGLPFNQPPPQQNTPTSAGPQSGQQMNNNKFPIPKTLQLSQQTQQPVASGPARPTIGHSGMMGVPGVQKVPQFTLEGEGDHVMSSRKLYDIVRQVTGSADPADGLTPDVEEAVLSMTDNFVDDVITKACQLAKLRQGQALDIRDIQIVLERGYGLRIPGYSLDETRSTRRFNPSAGWVSKVQAVQASKLTKGE